MDFCQYDTWNYNTTGRYAWLKFFFVQYNLYKKGKVCILKKN